MASTGKRKGNLFHVVQLFLFCALFTNVYAANAVLGIDLGTGYIKAAIAKPGSPIDIVLTKDSKRKEAAALAFKPSLLQKTDSNAFPERLYGGDALALSARYPSDVFINLKSALGMTTLSRPVNDYLYRFPGLNNESVKRSPDDGGPFTVAFKSQSLANEEAFMVEELLAMELKNIKANAEAVVGAGSHVSDVVITVPPYYTVEEKRALGLAAELAGLRVLGLISDGLAVGLNYATHRTFDSVTQNGQPEYHIVYDMGAGSTTATVLKFQTRTVKGPGKKNTTFSEVQALGYGADRNLGGDSLNDLVVQDMVKHFVESPKVKSLGLTELKVRLHSKTMARLWKDAEKVRQVLSANSVAHASLDGLYDDDIGFKYKLTRDDFEGMTREHAGRVAGPIHEALLMADMRLENIDSIILHGGLIRTPFVQKQLEAVVSSDKLKTNVNADEAAVMGAAFRAASISPAYRVKDVRATDLSGSTYIVSWTQEGKQKEQKLFVPTSLLGVEKQLTVKAQADTSIDFKHETLAGSFEVLSVELTNLTKSVDELKDNYGCVSANITTLLDIRLNPANGIPELSAASVSCKPQKDKDPSVIDSVKGMFGFGKKDQEPLAGEDSKEASSDPAATTPLPVDDPTSSNTIVSSASATTGSSSNSSSTTTAKKTKPTPTIMIIPLAKNIVIKGINQPPVEKLPTIRKRLTKFDESDQNTVLRAEALNVLEAYTYRARDYLEDATFIEFSPNDVRKQIQESLSSVSEWLYGDGIDAKLEDFKAKLKGLQASIDPVLKRTRESTNRQSAIDTLKGGISSAESTIEMIKSSIARAAAEAASSASSAASSVVEEASSVLPTSVDGELDEDPYATASSAAASATEAALPKMYEYTDEDLSSLTKAYDAVKTWLEQKVAAQEKLTKYDDPAILVADIESKAAQLQKTVTNIIMKQIRFATPPKATKRAKPSKKEKTKTKKGKNGSTDSATTSVTSATTSSSVKDEL